MAILKCKMCGGDIELSADKTFGTCDSCGSTMTFPKVDDEQRANAFNRGNHFRRTGEFDKALAVYERIVQENEDDAEAHWCCALCRFGIEYVEDPNTFEYLPTCHRASFDSFLEDVDYLAAVEHSDGVTRRQYQKDAAKIAEVQRGILATSQNEEPFDVFICYKESENDGSRTRDSLYAQDIYYQLTEQGRRVFFSRITLEDKAGTEYEPYIFAALNSAKVMIVVTTSAEHVNAVWVKNEWSRFLSLMRKDRSKLLLPCYRDMDPYDLPEALSVLQSYDMSKIGFIQDLIRGVNKVLDASAPKAKETVKETVVVQQANANAAPLLKRAFMFLEDGDFTRADEFCEQVLNLDPENAEAYLGKLMAELKVRKRDDLKDQPKPFDDRNNYQKVLRFGDEKLKKELSFYDRYINEHVEETKRKALAVVKALREGVKAGPTIEKKLDETKTSICTLERILDVFDATQAQISVLRNELNGTISREKQLTEERSRLGIFAVKEKKRIDEELAGIPSKKSDLTAQINQQISKIGRYVSLADVQRDLNKMRNNAAELELQVENAHANEGYSLDKACSIYLNEPETADEVDRIYPIAILTLAMLGKASTFKLGRYIQKDNDFPEPIEWQVLARNNGQMLVISKQALDCKPYDVSRSQMHNPFDFDPTTNGVTWKECSLRKWLNETFINEAFSFDEKKMIASINLPEDNTKDRVFLLSVSEANRYFDSDVERQCEATDYARKQGAFANDNFGQKTRWMLRANDFSKYVADVNYTGKASRGGLDVYTVKGAVRPAMWIDLS